MFKSKTSKQEFNKSVKKMMNAIKTIQDLERIDNVEELKVYVKENDVKEEFILKELKRHITF